jgi:hypothetical protein
VERCIDKVQNIIINKSFTYITLIPDMARILRIFFQKNTFPKEDKEQILQLAIISPEHDELRSDQSSMVAIQEISEQTLTRILEINKVTRPSTRGLWTFGVH